MKSPEKKRILIFSVDALVSGDIECLKTLPNLKKYLGGGAEVKKYGRYPTVTYPAHVTMATGCYPEKIGVNSNYFFSLNSKEDSCRGSMIAPLDLGDFRFGHATHGYLPEKGPQPVFCAKGPHIRGGVSLDSRRLVDEAPTYTRLLGVRLPKAQGSAIEEILI